MTEPVASVPAFNIKTEQRRRATAALKRRALRITLQRQMREAAASRRRKPK